MWSPGITRPSGERFLLRSNLIIIIIIIRLSSSRLNFLNGQEIEIFPVCKILRVTVAGNGSGAGERGGAARVGIVTGSLMLFRVYLRITNGCQCSRRLNGDGHGDGGGRFSRKAFEKCTIPTVIQNPLNAPLARRRCVAPSAFQPR